MVNYIISETRGGGFVVQTPNQWGGLFPLVCPDEDVRRVAECFSAIGQHALETGNLYDGVSVDFRHAGHRDNCFAPPEAA